MRHGETIQPDFSYFKEVASAVDLDSARAELRYAPTGEANATEGEQTLPVIIAHPAVRRGNEVVISGNAFSDEPGRPENLPLAQLCAAALGRTVVIVGSPSVESIRRERIFEPGEKTTLGDLSRHERSGDMNNGQLEELRAGRFGRIGKASIAAAIAALEIEGINDPNFVLYGSSQAAATSMGMLGALLSGEHMPKVSGVVLAEGVNYEKWKSKRHLIQTFVTNGQLFVPDALESNPEPVRRSGESPKIWIARTAMSAIANARYMSALAQGEAFSDIGSGSDQVEALQGVPVLLTRGSISELSTEDANLAMMTHLARHGANVDLKTHPHHSHSYTMSSGAAIGAIRQVLPQAA